jgi:hypothetical protein
MKGIQEDDEEESDALGFAAGLLLDFSALGLSEGEAVGWAVLDFSPAGLGAAGAESPAAGAESPDVDSDLDPFLRDSDG